MYSTGVDSWAYESYTAKLSKFLSVTNIRTSKGTVVLLDCGDGQQLTR